MKMTTSFSRAALHLLPIWIIVFCLGCQSVHLSEEIAKDLVFLHLQQHGGNLLDLSKEDLIPRMELLDLDGDGDSTHILSYQPYKKDEFGNVDYENILEVIYKVQDSQLAAIFSRKSGMPLVFSNYMPVSMKNRRIVFHWDNPPGGSSGNTPLFNLSAYFFENDGLTPLKLDDAIIDLMDGHITFDKNNNVLVRDEILGTSYALELINNSVSANKID